MTLLLLALLPSAVALVLLAMLGLVVLWRSYKGERWWIPLPPEGAEQTVLYPLTLGDRENGRQMDGAQIVVLPVHVAS